MRGRGIYTSCILVLAGFCLTSCVEESVSPGPSDVPLDDDRIAVALIPAVEFDGYVLAADTFEGTLTWTEDRWQFEGLFTFNTGGYIVDEPIITIRESYPEQVDLVLQVIAPPADAAVPDVITEIAVEATIPVSREAAFMVWIERTEGAPE